MGPFKCPDCGIWWAGVEHRCLDLRQIRDARCTCPNVEPFPRAPITGGTWTYKPCPLHPIQVTLTSTNAHPTVTNAIAAGTGRTDRGVLR